MTYRLELFRMGLCMTFPIFIWWTANQDWFYNLYIKPTLDKEKIHPPGIWETMYRARIAEMEGKEGKA